MVRAMDAGPDAWAEAARGADELAPFAHALADLLTEATARGSEIVHWSTARELRKKLNFIPGPDTDLWRMWIGAAWRPVVTRTQYFAAPETEDWTLFGLIRTAAALQLQGIAAELGRQGEKFPTQAEIKEIAAAFTQRQHMLDGLDKPEPPESDAEWAAVKQFLDHYVALATALRRYQEAICVYVDWLKADGRWPIRGD